MRLIPENTRDFDACHGEFRWRVPEHFNMGVAVSDAHAGRAEAVALYYENDRGDTAQYRFGDLISLSNRTANALRGLGVQRGDRVAIVLSQRIETALTHIAAHKLGAISVPLSVLFGPDALGFRLGDAGVKVVVTDSAHAALIESLRGDLPQLERVLVCDEPDGDFWPRLEAASEHFDAVQTLAEDPALIIYTSGTTGPPKGALIAHRCLIGNLPGFELSQHFFPQPGDVFWTPADWAWTGGLLDGLLPTWVYGMPIVGYECGKFDPQRALALMEKYAVSNTFIPPTALKMLRTVDDIPRRFKLKLRAVMSAGEALGEELLIWAREALGVELNEMWGQSEHNYIAGNCSAIMPVRPGSLGKPYPGHRVAVIDADGRQLADGEMGEFATHRDDAVHFLGYWQRPEAAAKKYAGDWFRTGDVGHRDADGYLWFAGRDDDVISSAGYRIGPGEIEDCLMRHPAVLQAAAVGVPDPEGLRGDIVKAFIILREGFDASDELAAQISQAVRKQLAAYEYPRQIEFLDTLPMTTTGKVRRIELRQRE